MSRRTHGGQKGPASISTLKSPPLNWACGWLLTEPTLFSNGLEIS